MTLTQETLFRAIAQGWSAASSTRWHAEHPARGQCSVTALLVKEQLGGRILKTRVGEAWHFYNELDGRRVDLTAAQFEAPIAYDDLPAEPTEALHDTSDAQLSALRAAVREKRAP